MCIPVVARVVVIAIVAAGCGDNIAPTPEQQPLLGGLYSYPGVGPIMCSGSIDGERLDADTLLPLLDVAAASASIVHLYAHAPGRTVSVARIEALLDAAAERGLAFVTYADLAAGGVDEPGLALSFDDADIADWYALRGVFAFHQVHVTFFVTRYPRLLADERAMLHDLAADGHAIEFHGTEHLDARRYVADHGLDAYLADEIDPGLAAMRADGFDPRVFAYPFGAHTAATDRALLDRFTLLRTVRTTCPR